MFLWFDFLPGLEEATKGRERVQPTLLHKLLKKRKKSKEPLAGSSTPAIDWVIGSPQCESSLRLRNMNHFLMTPFRSRWLSMQSASAVGLQVRRAGGVCSWAACHMLFLIISRCWVWAGHWEGKVAACAREVLMSHTQSSGRERNGPG